jgi:hypothetical protein
MGSSGIAMNNRSFLNKDINFFILSLYQITHPEKLESIIPIISEKTVGASLQEQIDVRITLQTGWGTGTKSNAIFNIYWRTSESFANWRHWKLEDSGERDNIRDAFEQVYDTVATHQLEFIENGNVQFMLLPASSAGTSLASHLVK